MNHVELLWLKKIAKDTTKTRDKSATEARVEEYKEYVLGGDSTDSPEVQKLKEQVQLLTQQIHRERTVYYLKGKADACNDFVTGLGDFIHAAEKDLKR